MATPVIKSSNHKAVIIWLATMCVVRTRSPIKQIQSVTSNWLLLQTMVNEIAFNRFPSFIYNTRPKYSPTLFGVVTENETPEKMAFNDFIKLMG